MGTSGGGPHVLALAARHPEKVTAVTVVVGASPLAPDEVEHLVGVNAQGYALAERGWPELYEFLAQVRVRLLSDEGMQGVLNDAPATDRAIMEDPAWQQMSRANLAETLKQGAEGWADESMALHRAWDFDPGDVKTSVTWWAGDDDKNVPLSSAQRVVAQMRHVDLRVWHHEGHFASLVHDKEIVQQLLSRST
jgi:pimeloyl-ACP methyl ester carboxylesterase